MQLPPHDCPSVLQVHNIMQRTIAIGVAFSCLEGLCIINRLVIFHQLSPHLSEVKTNSFFAAANQTTSRAIPLDAKCSNPAILAFIFISTKGTIGGFVQFTFKLNARKKNKKNTQ